MTDFIFDRFGHLLAEANDATGAMLREYIWLDNRPVAMVDDTGASPVVYYVHTDQLGTPQKITDGSANVVWDGVFDPFGNMVASTGANWGTGVWLSFTWEPTTPQTMPLRFPGQYADSETALNQNWNRDYDPTIGRYIESDPIGLDGGVNTYAYAFDSPGRLIDPWGLCGEAPPPNGQCSSLETGAGNFLRGAGHLVNIGGTGVLTAGVGIGVLGAPESGGVSFFVTGLFGAAAISLYGSAGDLDMLGAWLQSEGSGDTSYSNEAAGQSEEEWQNDVNAGPFFPLASATQTIADGVSDAYGEGPVMVNCH